MTGSVPEASKPLPRAATTVPTRDAAETGSATRTRTAPLVPKIAEEKREIMARTSSVVEVKLLAPIDAVVMVASSVPVILRAPSDLILPAWPRTRPRTTTTTITMSLRWTMMRRRMRMKTRTRMSFLMKHLWHYPLSALALSCVLLPKNYSLSCRKVILFCLIAATKVDASSKPDDCVGHIIAMGNIARFRMMPAFGVGLMLTLANIT